MGTTMRTGTHGGYEWLEVDHDLREFVSLCPGAILNKYLAITAVDSGFFEPSEEDRATGWTTSGGIAYSPRVETSAMLPSNCCCRECCGYNEWYIFHAQPSSLGSLCDDNVFTSEIGPGSVFQFINFVGFRFSDSRMSAIGDLYWRQMEWMQPESYVADAENCLLFATRNSQIYRTIFKALSNQRSKHSGSEGSPGPDFAATSDPLA